jgi:hypothetical protein
MMDAPRSIIDHESTASHVLFIEMLYTGGAGAARLTKSIFHKEKM